MPKFEPSPVVSGRKQKKGESLAARTEPIPDDTVDQKQKKDKSAATHIQPTPVVSGLK